MYSILQIWFIYEWLVFRYGKRNIRMRSFTGCSQIEKSLETLTFVTKHAIFMRAVIQRVRYGSVAISEKTVGRINRGLLVFLGIEDRDGAEDVMWLSRKIVNLRVFDDEEGVMNRSLKDCEGELLLISQFTLHASTKKGNRPSYIRAAKPTVATPLYQKMVGQLSCDLGKPIQTGIFGADMKVELLNDGPVTIVMDTKNKE